MKAATLLYVLVADVGRARIYKSTKPFRSLEVVYNQTIFTGSKMLPVSGLDLSGDGKGSRRQQTIGSLGKAPCDKCNSDERNSDKGAFVSDVCRVLQSHLRTEGYDALVMIAPRTLLNSFIRHLSRACQSTLVSTFNKTPGRMSEQDVIRMLDSI